MQWKGAFRSQHTSGTNFVADPGVVRASAEVDSRANRVVALPTNPEIKLSDEPAAPAPPEKPSAKLPEVREPIPPVRPLSPPSGPSRPATTPKANSNEREPTPESFDSGFAGELATQPTFVEKCISPRDLKSIHAITANIGVKARDLSPLRGVPPECSLGDASFRERNWHGLTFAWTAAGTCNKPLYFEEEQLERYGHCWGPIKQPIISTITFFATVPLLPYYMGVYPPNECIYTLGYYRPGSCAPYYLDPFPISVRGAIYEGIGLGLIPVAL